MRALLSLIAILIICLIPSAAIADGPRDICRILEPNSPESIKAGCCVNNDCDKSDVKNCACSEEINKINESILEISVAIEKLVRSNAPASDCKNKKDPSPHCRELVAQEKTACWAKIGGLTAIGALGLLFWTLRLQRKANKSLSRQNKLFSDATRNETRAYLHVKTAYFGTGHYPSVWLDVENNGGTPAKWFEIASASTNYKRNMSAEDFVDFSKIGQFTAWSAIASGGKLTAQTDSKDETLNVINVMNNNDREFLVYGIIRYCTIFDEIYETQFAFTKQTIAASVNANPQRGIVKKTCYMFRPPLKLDVFKDVTPKKDKKA